MPRGFRDTLLGNGGWKIRSRESIASLVSVTSQRTAEVKLFDNIIGSVSWTLDPRCHRKSQLVNVDDATS